MKLSKICLLSMSLIGLAVATTNEAFAQRGGGMPMGPQAYTRFQLATLSEVQSVLGLSDDQKSAASDMTAKMREEQRASMQGGGGGGGGGDRQAAMAKMNEMRQKMDGEFAAKLDDKQKVRMTGIMFQVVGAAALMDTELQGMLGITEDQKKGFADAQRKSREASRESMQGLRDMSPEERTEMMAKMRAESDKALLAVLNEEQKAKLEEIKGSELKVDLAPLRGRGGQGGPGGGRQRRDN
ncbi:hypothetical protein SH449x_004969 [Pirellulaceae bacterium SH449]